MDKNVHSEPHEITTLGWICPDCGTPNNHEHCDNCYRPRPLQGPEFYGDGSYFKILYGPVGIYGLPAAIALVILIVIITGFSLPIVDSFIGHDMRPLHPVRPHP